MARETQARAIYCRASIEDGNVLTGTVVRYSDTATLPFGKEQIEAKAFQPIGDVILNRQHDRRVPLARTNGGGLELIDSDVELRLRANLVDTVDGLDVLKLVRANVLRGFSVEFQALQERLSGDVVVVEKAVLRGIGLVDEPAYPQSHVDRERRMREDSKDLARSWNRLSLVYSGVV